MAQPAAQAPNRDEQVRREFEQVARNFRVGPSGYYYYLYEFYRDGMTRDPYRSTWSAYPGGPYQSNRDPLAPFRDGTSPPLSGDRSVAEKFLIAALRALLYAAALALVGWMAPSRAWAQVLDENNIAVAIVLAAIAVALAIVIAAPTW